MTEVCPEGCKPLQLDIDTTGNRLLVNFGNQSFAEFNIETFELVKTFDHAHYCQIIGVYFVGKNNYILSVGVDNNIYLWDSHTYEKAHQFSNNIEGDINKPNTYACTVSSCTRYFAIGGANSINVYSVEKREVLVSFTGEHKRPIVMLEFYENPNWLLSSDSHMVKIFNLEEETLEQAISNTHVVKEPGNLSIHGQKKDPIIHMDLSFCGNYLLTCAEGSDKLWRIIDEEGEIEEFVGDRGIRCSYFTKNGGQMICGCLDGRIRIWGLMLFEINFVIPDPDGQIPISIELSNDGKDLILGYENQMLSVFESVYMTHPQQTVHEFKMKSIKESRIPTKVNSRNPSLTQSKLGTERDINVKPLEIDGYTNLTSDKQENRGSQGPDDILDSDKLFSGLAQRLISDKLDIKKKIHNNKNAEIAAFTENQLPNLENIEHWGENKKNVKWNGYYIQDGVREEMTFDHFIVKFDGDCEGYGCDQAGDFDLKGRCDNISNTTEINFTKKYREDGEEIQYKSRIWESSIVGIWNYDNNKISGDFQMTFENEEFAGFYVQDDEKIDTLFMMNFGEDGLFGIGSDNNGDYILKGDWFKNSGTCRFHKMYFDSDDIYYVGCANDFNSQVMLQGKWVIEDIAHGDYELMVSIFSF